ncbi:sensor histidine kinase [Duganella sp. P38]|uniref:sensor histidine kinase n=1 Tax=Duganella sp. P38 TaxID=3423949 RepID=UPI003D7B8027
MSKFLHLVCLLALLAGVPAAHALDSKIALSDYHHDIWTSKDGAPGEVYSMAQTADGWLWIGASTGLYRFDGVRFTRFEALSGEVAPKRPVTALKALRNGDLLIGYVFGGLSLLSKGHISHYPSSLGNELMGPVLNAIRDDDGAVWAATTNGLLQLRQGAWRNVGEEMGLPPGRVSNILLDQYSQIWLAAGEHLVVLARGAKRFRTVLSGYSTVNLTASPDGRLWLDTHGKLITVPAQHPGPQLPRPAWMAQAEGQESGIFDRDGNYWTLGCPGMCRTDGIGQQANSVYTPAAEADSRLDQPWQVSNLTANVVFEDRDGNIWIGTQAGVERFRNNRLARARLNGGERFFSFGRDHDGRVLVWAKPTNELWRLNEDGSAVVLERGPASHFGVLSNSPDGALLKAGAQHIERRRGDAVEIIAYPDGLSEAGGVSATRILDDGRALWLSVSRRGTYRWQDGKWTHQGELGLPNSIAFAAPGGPGEMWFGYNDGLILHYENGRLTRYTPERGEDIGAITYIHQGPEVLIGGDGGLAVLQGEQFRRLNVADAEALSRVSGMVIAANGDRWFNGNKGVVHVRAAQWRAALADPRAPLEYTLYGVQQGYPGFAATANRQPSAIADAYGQLWFAGVGGIARLDSSRSDPPLQPPAVKLEMLMSQGKRYLDLTQPVVLPPGTTALRIEYTALSYTMPEALRFRYQLDGVDQGWQETGTRRAVSYTNLRPGDYRFRVAAMNQFGQWSKEEAVMSVRILPTFTQTPLFYGLCALAGAGLLYLLYRLWARQATLRIATRMAERERIARALHDTFLQSVHGLTLSFQSALRALPSDSASRGRIERVLLLADQVMEEGRNEVQDLRSGAMGDGDLAHGLALVGEVLQESHRAVFSLRTLGRPRRLDEQVACEAYSIAREALQNAFRHAGAASIQIVLEYAPGAFSLQVVDDGKGIADELIRNGSNGRWGLTGMFERAARIGGQLALENVEGGGTRVRLEVTAARAYAGQARWKRWLPRWLRAG